MAQQNRLRRLSAEWTRPCGGLSPNHTHPLLLHRLRQLALHPFRSDVQALEASRAPRPCWWVVPPVQLVRSMSWAALGLSAS